MDTPPADAGTARAGCAPTETATARLEKPQALPGAPVLDAEITAGLRALRAPLDAGDGGPPMPVGSFEWSDCLLRTFVKLHSGLRQRGADWYAQMGVTVGGSEVAKLLRMSPYGSFYDIVDAKVAARRGEPTWDGGKVPCWWGTFFEPIIEAVVGVDLGAPIRGTDICIQAAPGYRNSPDGYIVIRCEAPEETPEGGTGPMRIWSTDQPPPSDAALARIAMLEFKCPYSRKPDGRVPSHYRPQVWSGLAVSPVAHLGLFVEAVFRKCSLSDLGPSASYDTEYHRGTESWGGPIAWGLVAVYAPLLAAPRRVRLGWKGPEWAAGDPSPDAPDADAAAAAWQIHAACLATAPGAQDGRLDALDLGDCPSRTFERALGLIDRGRFRTAASPPCFADGRGAPLAVGAWIAQQHAAAPPDHWLLGLLPWKLFEVDYLPVARRPGFLEEVLPLIDAVHAMASEALASPDPEAYLRMARATKPAPGPQGRVRASPEDSRGTSYTDAGSLQELFDAISGPS